MKPFIGRKIEFQKLNALQKKSSSSIVVVKGRRRVGKSRFIAEFSEKNKEGITFFSFSGLAPSKEVTLATQLDNFGRQLASCLNIPPVTFSDWIDALTYLGHHVSKNDIILFDEISWMGAQDPAFTAKLKVWWDVTLSQKERVLVFFCGSVSTWIEENIVNSTAFFGRISLILTLNPLSIPESAEFLRCLGFKGSPIEYYKILSVLGGIPWYLEQIDPSQTSDQNIKNLCFVADGLLVEEFQRIFNDLFNGRSLTYKKILESLNEGVKTLAEIREVINYSHSGTLSVMLEHLITAGFIHKHQQWSFKTEKPLKQSLYRISDPYTRFYFKVIEPKLNRIQNDAFKDVPMSQLPGYDIHMGFQVEHLLLQNRALLLEKIGINGSDCSQDGPYRQTQTKNTKGCQIDYLVQTQTRNLYLSEFKFKKWEIGTEIVEEVREKMNRLSIPRGFSLVPVLFHIGGVSMSVYDANYFYRIIDIADFLVGQ